MNGNDGAGEQPAVNARAQAEWGTKASRWVRDARLLDHAFAPFTDAVVQAADLGTAWRVLDVGCGTGTLLEASVERGARAVGVDISLDMVEAPGSGCPRRWCSVAMPRVPTCGG
ncbi:class I SAM-dependent methyltransferase [Nocardioides sp. AE5]|uniref:class I SAM-dependent methyltransferase n=1 Tax=Nocardioides sp. AE5 TaxID=2962573 RepID=UPI002880F89F|nr:class I SAM-dependent methyltransferase [Nocardioides sp. AE5]MDT0201052.1 class I SAM-dependent methyltransferase [Nocardioides sp. AE5]